MNNLFSFVFIPPSMNFNISSNLPTPRVVILGYMQIQEKSFLLLLLIKRPASAEKPRTYLSAPTI